MRIGIVGSRRRAEEADFNQVLNLLKSLREVFGNDLVVVSGACPKGADNHAKLVCTGLGIPIVEFPAKFQHVSGIENYAKAYYARNTAIAEFCERLYAQVADDRTGGTEDTVRKAINMGRSVYLLTTDGRTVPHDEPKQGQSRLTL
jgi:hypothetical protein